MADIDPREFQKIVDTMERIDERTRETQDSVRAMQEHGLPYCSVHASRLERIEKVLNGQLTSQHDGGWGGIKWGKFQASGKAIIVSGLVAMFAVWMVYRTESTANAADKAARETQKIVKAIGVLE